MYRDNMISDALYALACGPNISARGYSGCIANGVRFHSKDRDSHRITQNSGVMVSGDDESGQINFYGELHEIIKLQYIKMKTVNLFKCQWYDTSSRKHRISVTDGFTSINTRYRWYKDEPFILASQAIQVFYLDDYQLGQDWRIIQQIQPKRVWDIPEVEINEIDEVLCSNETIRTCYPQLDDNLDSQTFNREDVAPSFIGDQVDLLAENNEEASTAETSTDEEEIEFDYLSDESTNTHSNTLLHDEDCDSDT